MLSGWKEKAVSYYIDGLSFQDISILLEVSRQTIASYIKSLPDYESLLSNRQKARQKERRVYKREKQKEYRDRDSHMQITGESLRREHELAVMELSRERYH